MEANKLLNRMGLNGPVNLNIYKYKINSASIPKLMQTSPGEVFNITMVRGSLILDVQAQLDRMEGPFPVITGSIWAVHKEEETQLENRSFLVALTGKVFAAQENDVYIGTYMVHEGKVVCHLFERLSN